MYADSVKSRLRAIVLILFLQASLLTPSHALGWPEISAVSLNNKYPSIGEIISWNVTVDCNGSKLLGIDLSYKDPVGVRKIVSVSNSLRKLNVGSSGTFELPLKITNEAPPGDYKIESVSVECVGDPAYPGRYKFGGYQGDLRSLGFTVNNPLFTARTPPLIKGFNIKSATSVSSGEIFRVEMEVQNSGLIDGATLILSGPNSSYQESASAIPSLNQQRSSKPGSVQRITFQFLIDSRWPKGSWKGAGVWITGIAGMNREEIDLNVFPYNSTDLAQREIRIDLGTPNGYSYSIPESSINDNLLDGLKFEVVELSAQAKAKLELELKKRNEAPAKNLILPQLKFETINEAIVKKISRIDGSLLMSTACIRDLEMLGGPIGALVELEEQSSQEWKKVAADAKWVPVENCNGKPSTGFGRIISVIPQASSITFRIKITYSSDSLFVPMASSSPSNHSRAILESVALETLDLFDFETALDKQRRDELRIQSDLKAKADAEAKAKADAEAKEKAEAEIAAAEAAAKAKAAKKSTIVCVKGKLTKKVTAVNPKCPKGYKTK